MTYLDMFTLPIRQEATLLRNRARHNGDKAGCIDNPYPCSGKSTLLNLIAGKLQLNRPAVLCFFRKTPEFI